MSAVCLVVAASSLVLSIRQLRGHAVAGAVREQVVICLALGLLFVALGFVLAIRALRENRAERS